MRSKTPAATQDATLTKLQVIEPTLRDKSTAIAKEVVGATTTGFTVESEAVGSKDVFKLTSENGEVSRTCTTTGTGNNGGGCKGGSW